MKILIADNNTLIREGLKSILLSQDWEVREVSNVSEIVKVVKVYQPELLILEINLCNTSIKNLLKEITEVCTFTKTLIISECNCELPVMIAIAAGISGFVDKMVQKEELLIAISTIKNGKKYFSQDITTIMSENYFSTQNSNYELTERESEVLKYICKGKSNEQIGDMLYISENTIATHKRNLMKKLGVKKTSDLILWAVDNRILMK